MTTEITRTLNTDGSAVVQRVKDGTFQVLKESQITTGEIPDPESDLITTETIVITRRIGINQDF